MVQIREAADQLAAEQTQRVVTCRRVDELIAELEQTLGGAGGERARGRAARCSRAA